MASQITSLTIVYSTVYSGADQRKHQSSVSLAFVRGINWGPVNSLHKWPVKRKMFPFDNFIMIWKCDWDTSHRVASITTASHANLASTLTIKGIGHINVCHIKRLAAYFCIKYHHTYEVYFCYWASRSFQVLGEFGLVSCIYILEISW